MTEKPILFSGNMIRAILEDRKFQTRRVIKPQPPDGFRLWEPVINGNASWTNSTTPQGIKGEIFNLKSPYGDRGDRLWVRETFQVLVDGEYWWHEIPTYHHWMKDNARYFYRADHPDADVPRWIPSIHMPRFLSRITLAVIDVNVERLQDITTRDIIEEGIIPEPSYLGSANRYRHGFIAAWDQINAKRGYSWDSNPWVWAIEFEVIES